MPWLDRDTERRRLSSLLLERGEATRRELQDAVGLSQPSLSRLLSGLDGLVKLGSGRHTRYALRRDAMVKEEERAVRYPELAAASATPGRFRASLRLAQGEREKHVVVKFTAATPSPARRRWADLLVCEHLALETLRLHGHHAAQTEVLSSQGRVFLEVTRFERRAPSRPSTPPGADQLAARAWFRSFIGCASTHAGHASYLAGDALPLSAVPAHDLLPTLWAPVNGTLPETALVLPELADAERALWRPMLVAARDFWTRAAADVRISSAFRAIAAQNRAALLVVESPTLNP